jgi:BirA family biotin operon repressor/biotin-[acetyl-CoA-carboxylase] ligase
MTIHQLAETTSTNDEAKKGGRNGEPHGAVWVAEKQTAGRGRQGRAWISDSGNLMFSVLLRIAPTPVVALAAGLAARDAIGNKAQVKWPNDVLINGKKVAGVLAEGCEGFMVVGIGINVRSAPPDLPATSVVAEGGNADGLLDRVLENLLRDAPRVAKEGLAPIHARLLEADALRGRHVRTDEGVEGIASGIDLEGRLIVGEHRLAYGEVHLV